MGRAEGQKTALVGEDVRIEQAGTCPTPECRSAPGFKKGDTGVLAPNKEGKYRLSTIVENGGEEGYRVRFDNGGEERTVPYGLLVPFLAKEGTKVTLKGKEKTLTEVKEENNRTRVKIQGRTRKVTYIAVDEHAPPRLRAGPRMPSMLLAPVIEADQSVEVPPNLLPDQPPVRVVHGQGETSLSRSEYVESGRVRLVPMRDLAGERFKDDGTVWVVSAPFLFTDENGRGPFRGKGTAVSG